MSRQKEVEVVVLDISPSMGCYLQEAKNSLILRVQQKLIHMPLKCDFGMLVLGSSETRNTLYSEEDYLYIHEKRSIQQIDADLFKLFLALNHEVDAGDWLDAVIVAMDMIITHCGQKKFEKRIIVVTNDSRQARDSGQIEDIGQALLDKGIHLEFLCTPNLSPSLDKVRSSDRGEPSIPIRERMYDGTGASGRARERV